MNTIPTVIEKQNNTERVYDLYSRLLKDRIIFIDGEINDINSNIVIGELLYLSSQNNNDIQINPIQDKKIESIQSQPEKQNEEEKKSGNDNNANKVKVDDDDEDSADKRIRKIMNLSVKGVKKLGTLMKKGGIKGYGLAKKYGKATVKMTKKYVKENVSYFNKDKDGNSNVKGDNNNQ